MIDRTQMQRQSFLSVKSHNFMQQFIQQTQINSTVKITFNPRKVNSMDKKGSHNIVSSNPGLKKSKVKKITYESRPFSIGSKSSFNPGCQGRQNSPSKVQADIINQMPFNSSKMMPVNTCSWVTNSKRVQKKMNIIKRGSSDEMTQKYKSKQLQDIDEDMSHDLKDYLQSVKSYFVQHKKKVQIDRKMKVNINNQLRYHLEDQGNLNIVRLKPYKQGQRGLTIQSQKEQYSPEYRSTQNNSNFSPTNSQFDKPQRVQVRTASTNRASERIFRKKVAKKTDYHFIFGQFKPFMTDNATQERKILAYSVKMLYYRDFLWKISFNRGFFLSPPTETYRFYVGKGNNSRLIRRIMSKRQWWVQESKQQNAHFIWTQLKVYDIIKNQKTQKKQKQQQKMEEKHLMQGNGFLTTSQFFPQKSQFLQAFPQQDKNRYILNDNQYKKWRSYIKGRGCVEKKAYEDMHQRYIQKIPTKKVSSHKITNHLQFSRVIGNKKALHKTMQAYLNFKGIQDHYLPYTFHITGGIENQEYLAFLREYYKMSKEGFNWWIVKPGELSNRGKDIKYCSSLPQIKEQIKQRKTNPNGSPRTYLVQSYINKPYLYQGRKFDLRHYFMLTSTQGSIRGYFYQQGYARTTSYAYSLDHSQPAVHLTNDAIQKNMPHYGKYQKANKLSYNQLNDYMIKKNPNKGFYATIFPQIKKITTEIIHAAYPFIDTQRRSNNFQIFGIDIMIDENFKCWLIEVNTNPCIEVNCKVLASIVPGMLDNAFTIGLDSIMTPPLGKPKVQLNNYLLDNKFQLVFDEDTHGPQLEQYVNQNIEIVNYGDDDDNFESAEEDNFDF